MSRVVSYLRQHTLWVGFAAVLAPLALLLGAQFVWLSRLERVSAIARQAALYNYLEAIGSEVQYFYRSAAERSLNVPASLFTQGRLEKVAAAWKSRPTDGVRRLFLVDYTRQPFGNFLVFNPESGLLEAPLASDESLAIIVACTPWQVLSYRKGRAPASALHVDERNAEERIILNPILDEASGVVGVAGMILDEEYFIKKLLPEAIDRSLPSFFPDVSRAADLGVMVRDAKGTVILSARDDAVGGAPAVTTRFPFVFGDWTLSLQSPRTGPERWARAGFTFNMSLSVLLAAALMGGILLALRAANRAMKLSAMKSDFVSNVSHELRTPLASIRVFAELLRLGKAAAPEKVQEYGGFIEGESRRLTRLIDNILDFSRIESGRKSYRLVQTDLHEIVEATVRSFEVHLRRDGPRLLFEGPTAPLPLRPVDPDAIALALHNLLDNAVKYSGKGQEVRVRLAREEDELVIEVRDDGIGIARDEQRRIFERFHRVSTGLLHEVKGSGLGLSIVHHIVQVHGGRVTVDSEPGKGSRFCIRLPLG